MSKADAGRIAPTESGWWWTKGNPRPVEVAWIGDIHVNPGQLTRDLTSLWVAGDSWWRGSVGSAPDGFFIAQVAKPGSETQ